MTEKVTKCENCEKPIRGKVVWTADDIPLCLTCARALWPKAGGR